MRFIARARRKVVSATDAAVRLPFELWLGLAGRRQRRKYANLRGTFGPMLASIPAASSGETTQLWNDFNVSLGNTLLPWPRWDFLRDRIISPTMVMTRGGLLLREQLAFLEARFPPSELRRLLREDAFGSPRIDAPSVMTSHNSIHHLYHISRFMDATGVRPREMRTVVEWGGGYGNFAKLWLRLAPQSTYCIIDTPLLTCLQWLYLSVVQDAPAAVLSRPTDSVREGTLNLIPLSNRLVLPASCDLFVSTWALSESPVPLQIEVAAARWYGARHLLLGYQESNEQLPDAGRLGEFAKGDGAVRAELPILRGQHYAFK